MMIDDFYADLSRLANLRARIRELEHGGFGMTGINDQKSTSGVIEVFKRSVEGLRNAWPNDRLIAAYVQALDEPSNRGMNAICAEIRHRNLNTKTRI